MSVARRDPDAVVIGSGPNGLVAACVLAGAGMDVLVLEAHPERAGGAVGSEAATRPGYVHDVGAAFFPWGALSPAFRALPLERHGLHWRWAPIQSCHPAPDGSVASIVREPDRHDAAFGGDSRDAERWRRVAGWYRGIEPDVIGLLMGPFPSLAPLRRLGAAHAARLGRIFTSSGRGLAERWFRSTEARRVLPSLALHADVGPDDRFGAGLGFMLAMTATTGGYAVPEGGARAIAGALVGCLRERGGEVRLGARVERVRVRQGRAVAVQLAGGEEIATRVILADTDVASLLLDLARDAELPRWLTRFLRRYPRGWGTFKVDWALDGPVPWSADAARRSAVVHVGDSLDDLSRFTREVRDGRIPERPYLVIGQQSVADPSRAPAGGHTLWAYTRVPSKPEGGWAARADGLADAIDARIEELAPGFRARILARRIVSPERLEAMDANLVGGDLGGGSNAWNRQLMFRPVFPWFRYRLPVDRLYLCSSYAHPGAGVHGMCGFNAAHRVVEDLG
jgi:phytoene dehydrogenase-like protein